MKDGDYSEIVLKGDSKWLYPIAVFIRCKNTFDETLATDPNFRRACTVANLYDLPLVVFSESNKTIRIITEPEIVA